MDSVEGFIKRYLRAPNVVWSAPGRANLIGEHTDYNDGLVRPVAIAERTVAAAGRGDPDGDVVAVTSAGYPDVARHYLRDVGRGTIPGWAAYPLGVAWALQPHAKRPGPVSALLSIASDIPAGGGLSSSAALEIAIGSALDDLWDLGLSSAELARAAAVAARGAGARPHRHGGAALARGRRVRGPARGM